VQEQMWTMTANLVVGLGIDERFVRSTATETDELLADALGSTLALANAAGTIQTAFTYEPFGVASASGSSSTNSYTFTGREDDGTGLY